MALKVLSLRHCVGGPVGFRGHVGVCAGTVCVWSVWPACGACECGASMETKMSTVIHPWCLVE